MATIHKALHQGLWSNVWTRLRLPYLAGKESRSQKNRVDLGSIGGPATVKVNRSWRHRAKPPAQYGAALFFVVAAFTFMHSQEESFLSPSFQTPPFFCAIVLSSWFGGFRPGLIATALSLFIIKFFYTVPFHDLAFSLSEIPRFSILFLSGVFISWLGGRQKRDEEALMRAREELEEKVWERTADLRAANEKVAALADERSRLAADVHDTSGQAFAATLLHLRSMEMSDVDDADLRAHWQFAQETAASGLVAARRAMNAMRATAPVNGRPLPERLAERVRQSSARSQAKVLFTVKGATTSLPWMVEDELERLASEGLFNAERHSAAAEINVELDYSSSPGLRLCVRDNGRGFDLDNPVGSGLGLGAMHERAERIGASFTLITECGRGTEIIVSWMPNSSDRWSDTANEKNS
jgi:signal transduction histidine kinase